MSKLLGRCRGRNLGEMTKEEKNGEQLMIEEMDNKFLGLVEFMVIFTIEIIRALFTSDSCLDNSSGIERFES